MNLISLLPTDEKKTFLSALLAIEVLDGKIVGFINERLHVQRFEKGTLLLPLGNVCDKLYFVHSGLVRGYYMEGLKEVTSWLLKENDFLYSPHSFLRQQPTSEAIELLEGATLVSITYQELQQIYDSYPTTNNIGRLLTEKYLLLYDERVRTLRALTAEQRLKRFTDDNPEFYARVNQKYIASYLGIAPETASRILKKKQR